jgi:hypothetical protein
MTGLAFHLGVSLERIKTEFGQSYLDYLANNPEIMDDELLLLKMTF